MDRRAFLWGMTLGVISLPLAVNAQRAGKVYRIGVLSPLHVPIYMTPFAEGLRDLGWVEGRDFTLESRFRDDTPDGSDRAAREPTHQPQGGQGSRSHDPVIAAVASGPGH